jgi:hypothetical protein
VLRLLPRVRAAREWKILEPQRRRRLRGAAREFQKYYEAVTGPPAVAVEPMRRRILS